MSGEKERRGMTELRRTVLLIAAMYAGMTLALWTAW